MSFNLQGSVTVEFLDKRENPLNIAPTRITVEASKFSLSEGGGIETDPDDGSKSCSALYLAACDGFSLFLNVSWTQGNEVSTSVYYGDVEAGITISHIWNDIDADPPSLGDVVPDNFEEDEDDDA